MKIHEKLTVSAALTIPGLLRGQREQFTHERKIEVQQEGPVKQDGAALASLGVAGEFTAVDGEVRVAANGELEVGSWKLEVGS